MHGHPHTHHYSTLSMPMVHLLLPKGRGFEPSRHSEKHMLTNTPLVHNMLIC